MVNKRFFQIIYSLFFSSLFLLIPLDNIEKKAWGQEMSFEKLKTESIEGAEFIREQTNKMPEWLDSHYKKVFGWNYTSSKIMFIMVVLVVSSGLLFSFLQFNYSVIKSKKIKSLKDNFNKENALEKITEEIVAEQYNNEIDEEIVELKVKQIIHHDEGNNRDLNKEKIANYINSDLLKTELRISKDGIEVSSSVIGLITLVISLMFLWLYLYFVHPIRVINLGDINNQELNDNKSRK